MRLLDPKVLASTIEEIGLCFENLKLIIKLVDPIITEKKCLKYASHNTTTITC